MAAPIDSGRSYSYIPTRAPGRVRRKKADRSTAYPKDEICMLVCGAITASTLISVPFWDVGHTTKKVCLGLGITLMISTISTTILTFKAHREDRSGVERGNQVYEIDRAAAARRSALNERSALLNP